MRGLWFLDFIFIPSKKRGEKITLPKTTAHLPEPSLEDTGNKIFNKNVEKLALYSQRTLVYSLSADTGRQGTSLFHLVWEPVCQVTNFLPPAHRIHLWVATKAPWVSILELQII